MSPPVKLELELEVVGENGNIPSPVTITPVQVTSARKAFFTLAILVYINTLNYMDRSTIPGVMNDIQKWFNIENKKAGLMITVFVCSYMVFAPICGYLGDRYSRKYVMAVGIAIWSGMTFAGSLMKRHQYYEFLVLRGLVGIGEASYSTVAPTIIADLFIGNQRTKALTVFYFAIPVGTGLGYMIGSKFAALMGTWQWALRFTPVLGIAALVLILVVVVEPTRGALECDIADDAVNAKPQSYWEDLKEIMKVRSFFWSTLGATCVCFAVGALSVWAPIFTLYAHQVHEKTSEIEGSGVSFIFGIVTVVAGFSGVALGSLWARKWKVTNMKADGFVCGIGVTIGAPLLFLALWMCDKYTIPAWIIMCFGETFLFFNWTPNADILLYVIPPNCRATAEAIQILILHVFGDAISPTLIGAISDAYIDDHVDDVEVKHLGLLYSLYVTIAVVCVGAVCYFITAAFLTTDKNNVDKLRGDSNTTKISYNLPTLDHDGGIVNRSYSGPDM